MNTITVSLTRLKRGRTPYLHNGKTVYVWRHRDDGRVQVSYLFRSDDTFIVERDELEAANQWRPTIATRPKTLTDAQKAFKSELNIFYADQLLMCPAACEECQTPFYGYNKEELRGLIAHILPKSLNSGFPTVATHPKNRLFLGTKCGRHNAWDGMGAKERSEMACYKIALERFEKFADELSEKDLQLAYKYLYITPQREGN